MLPFIKLIIWIYAKQLDILVQLSVVAFSAVFKTVCSLIGRHCFTFTPALEIIIQALYCMVWLFLTTSVALKQKSTQSDKEGVCYYFTHAEKMGQRAVQPITMWKSLYEVVHQRLVNRLNHIGSGSLSTGIVFALKYYLFSFSVSAWRLLDNICSFHVLEILLLVLQMHYHIERFCKTDGTY